MVHAHSLILQADWTNIESCMRCCKQSRYRLDPGLCRGPMPLDKIFSKLSFNPVFSLVSSLTIKSSFLYDLPFTRPVAF